MDVTAICSAGGLRFGTTSRSVHTVMPQSSLATPRYAPTSSRRAAKASTLLLRMADLERGQRIRQLRDHRSEERGRLVTQPEVADAVGVTLRAVQDWEAGKGIKLEHAKKLAAYYGVSQHWLMYGEQDSPNNLPAEDSSQLDRIEQQLQTNSAQLEAIRGALLTLIPGLDLGEEEVEQPQAGRATG